MFSHRLLKSPSSQTKRGPFSLHHILTLKNLKSEATAFPLFKKDIEDFETCFFLRPCSVSCGSPDLTPDQPLVLGVTSQDPDPPSSALWGVMMLSLACRSLTRQGVVNLAGSAPPRLRRLGGAESESVEEETALSWVAPWLQHAGGGGGEAGVGWLRVDSRVFREHMGDMWSHLRRVEESEEQNDTGEGGGGGALL